MPADQLERKDIMVEVVTVLVHAIVTTQAVIAEREQMHLRKDNIHFTVAVLAGDRVEG